MEKEERKPVEPMELLDSVAENQADIEYLSDNDGRSYKIIDMFAGGWMTYSDAKKQLEAL